MIEMVRADVLISDNFNIIVQEATVHVSENENRNNENTNMEKYLDKRLR
jgi:hypothetical protein